ncbi:MAG: HypC/HybG/HupF family hydrogenase formation chaperone [Eubacterium sp.]|nr:HypC/HybG/HupF family hydrogenase formation chaperone [Eubacterium sp.]
MCVAYPGTVIEIKEKNAVVDFGGNRVNARTGLVQTKPGDRVLVHAGCVMQVVSEEEAKEIEEIMKEMEQ